MRSGLAVIVVAAGSSRRMSGIDKVWAPLGEWPVFAHALRAFSSLTLHTVLVMRPDAVDRARREILPAFPWVRIVSGGKERQESVRRGLQVVDDAALIAVHDAARPFASAELLENGLDALGEHDGAVPVETLHDTVKRVSDDGDVVETVERRNLRLAQTPQVFRAAALLKAHLKATEDGFVGTDDAMLLERSGYSVVTFPGAAQNFKITTDFDLTMARLLLSGAR